MASGEPLAAKGPLNFDAWLETAYKRHIDPYTVWSLGTKFREFIVQGKAPTVLDFIAELTSPWSSGGSPWTASGAGWRTEVPEIYEGAMPGSSATSKHVTVRLQMLGKDPQEVINAVFLLMFAKGVKRVQIGFPRPDQPNDANQSDGGPRNDASPDPVASEASAPKVVFGLLEDGCPFGHPALTTDMGKSRVIALWDQSSGAHSRVDPSPDGLGYGRQRLRVSLDGLLSKHRMAGGVDEEALYLDPAALQPRPPKRGSHAAAVTTLLAGRRSRLPWHPTFAHPGDTDVGLPRSSQEPDDPAAAALLVVVQFPREQINVVGARWLMVRALDGLRYIGRTAAQLTAKDELLLPLVVNISYGSMVGAHDGTGLFETAMTELCEANKGMAIVLAAGNSYGTRRQIDGDNDLARTASGRHATHESLAAGETSLLRLYIPPNKPIETYLEIWFEDHSRAPDEEQFLEPNDVEIVVTSPIGKELLVKGDQLFDFDEDDAEQIGAGLMCVPLAAQSSLRSMALVAVAATQMSSTRVEVPSGVWSVKITNTSATRRFRLQAWVERDLVAGAARRSQAARLQQGEEAHAAKVTDSNTFNNIATGRRVFRAGALMAMGHDGEVCVSPYSSAAATAESGPEFSAVADESAARLGLRVSGNSSGAVLRANGTSVAAPQAARWIANRLAEGPGAPEERLAQIWAEIASASGDARLGRIKL